jgi:hypothetical protein
MAEDPCDYLVVPEIAGTTERRVSWAVATEHERARGRSQLLTDPVWFVIDATGPGTRRRCPARACPSLGVRYPQKVATIVPVPEFCGPGA